MVTQPRGHDDLVGAVGLDCRSNAAKPHSHLARCGGILRCNWWPCARSAQHRVDHRWRCHDLFLGLAFLSLQSLAVSDRSQPPLRRRAEQRDRLRRQRAAAGHRLQADQPLAQRSVSVLRVVDAVLLRAPGLVCLVARGAPDRGATATRLCRRDVPVRAAVFVQIRRPLRDDEPMVAAGCPVSVLGAASSRSRSGLALVGVHCVPGPQLHHGHGAGPVADGPGSPVPVRRSHPR